MEDGQATLGARRERWIEGRNYISADQAEESRLAYNQGVIDALHHQAALKVLTRPARIIATLATRPVPLQTREVVALKADQQQPPRHPHDGDLIVERSGARHTRAFVAGGHTHPGVVLAKGAGPGIWNRWSTCVQGRHVLWARVRPEYLV